MEGESTAAFIFDDLGSLRLVLRAYLTKPLHRRVARSGASSTSDVRGSQDRHEPCEEDNAKVLVTFLWDGRQHKGAIPRHICAASRQRERESLLDQVRLISR